MRCFADGLIECPILEQAQQFAEVILKQGQDSKGFVSARHSETKLAFRVFRPDLLRKIEQDWAERQGQIGRWCIQVRSDGVPAGEPQFIPCELDPELPGADRLTDACRKMSELFVDGGGSISCVYLKSAPHGKIMDEYVLAWKKALAQTDPAFPEQVNHMGTLEVRSLSGACIGLIVLPIHPLRMAWHMGYDALALHTRFEQGVPAEECVKTLASLDGSLFPAFLPGFVPGQSFTFGDCLGFYGAAMVLGNDSEPKATIALLANTLGISPSTEQEHAREVSPTVGEKSATILGQEIVRYLACHSQSRFLHIHALRPGDGKTVARALGYVLNDVEKRRSRHESSDGSDQTHAESAQAFVLDLHPGPNKSTNTGRYLAEVIKERRAGSAEYPEADQWITKSFSLPSGVQVPRLQWAKREFLHPKKPAHLSVAFDTFQSQVTVASSESAPSTPLHVFGLSAHFVRHYSEDPVPQWQASVSVDSTGEGHPAGSYLTARVLDIHSSILLHTARNLDSDDDKQRPILHTEISPQSEEALKKLHQLSDWVVTIDRNAGIEYFDSPNSRKPVYDAYVIDCVPEREDLGCLQLVTSTSNLDEVGGLLGNALDGMGLSHSPRNARFLLDHLKALSGRLAIRLTGKGTSTGELIALALTYKACREASVTSESWPSLNNGFFIPLDDIRDLLPPALTTENSSSSSDEQNPSPTAVRADLLHISLAPRTGLFFRFVEVKYRRDLRSARSGALFDHVRMQTAGLKERWQAWYFGEDVSATQRAIRRSKLARILRFYAEKAVRHYLQDQNEIVTRLRNEIDKLVADGANYQVPNLDFAADRGFIFCPEVQASSALLVSGELTSECQVYLFGPDLLPDNDRRPARYQAVAAPDAKADLCEEAGIPNREDSVTSYGCDTMPAEDQLSTLTVPPVASASSTEGTANLDVRNDWDSPALERSDASDAVNQPPAVSVDEVPRLAEAATVMPPSTPEPEIDLGSDVATGKNVIWTPSVKNNPHLLMAGLPGMGKTHCLARICQQLAVSGVTPIVFSFHQDIDEKLQEMLGDVRFLDFDSLGFNPLHVHDLESPQAYLDVAGSVRDILSAIFPELGDIQAGRIREALKASYTELGWGDPGRDKTELEAPDFSRFYQILSSDAKPDRGLVLRLGELDDYGIFNTSLGPMETTSLLDEHRPTVLRIHRTQNEMAQRAFSFLVFYSLYKNMFRRGPQAQLTHAIVFDEAHRASRLKLIPTMAKECRKYGISLILASQEAKDFDPSLYSAVANYLILRLTEADAKSLARNVVPSDQERLIVDKIKQMQKYTAVWMREGRSRFDYIKLSP